jgi:hypothetical protein
MVHIYAYRENYFDERKRRTRNGKGKESFGCLCSGRTLALSSLLSQSHASTSCST